jgi:hypothetical protein
MAFSCFIRSLVTYRIRGFSEERHIPRKADRQAGQDRFGKTGYTNVCIFLHIVSCILGSLGLDRFLRRFLDVYIKIDIIHKIICIYVFAASHSYLPINIIDNETHCQVRENRRGFVKGHQFNP